LDTSEQTPAEGYRCGFVAIAGRPNVGKSTLMNRLVQERLAIVTSKPQTTRRRTLGVLHGDNYQMILLDTPGLMEPHYDLHRAMLREAREALQEADVILFLSDWREETEIPEAILDRDVPRVLAVNKVDRLRNKAELLPVLQRWHDTSAFRELVPISALEGDGVDALVRTLVDLLPAAPPYYPPDQIADQPERFFVAEIIRERLLQRYEREVPYACEVQIETFTERPEAKDYIEAWIYVEHESQKAIVIGKGGEAIRALGEDARAAIEAFLDRPVFLTLRVKVLPDWRRRAGALRRMGYRAQEARKKPRR